MSLVKCPDCQSDFSDEAPACPKCGRPNLKAKDAQGNKVSATLGILLGIAGCWAWLGERVYLIFPADTLIFGGILLLYGMMLFVRAPGRK